MSYAVLDDLRSWLSALVRPSSGSTTAPTDEERTQWLADASAALDDRLAQNGARVVPLPADAEHAGMRERLKTIVLRTVGARVLRASGLRLDTADTWVEEAETLTSGVLMDTRVNAPGSGPTFGSQATEEPGREDRGLGLSSMDRVMGWW